MQCAPWANKVGCIQGKMRAWLSSRAQWLKFCMSFTCCWVEWYLLAMFISFQDMGTVYPYARVFSYIIDKIRLGSTFFCTKVWLRFSFSINHFFGEKAFNKLNMGINPFIPSLLLFLSFIHGEITKQSGRNCYHSTWVFCLIVYCIRCREFQVSCSMKIILEDEKRTAKRMEFIRIIFHIPAARFVCIDFRPIAEQIYSV